MIARLLLTISFVCCALVIASFALFAHDQVAGASKHQQNELAAVTPTQTPVAVHKVGQPRRFIDAASHDLTSPFSSIVHTQNPWVDHGLPSILALIVYGLGLGYLARFSRGLA